MIQRYKFNKRKMPFTPKKEAKRLILIINKNTNFTLNLAKFSNQEAKQKFYIKKLVLFYAPNVDGQLIPYFRDTT